VNSRENAIALLGFVRGVTLSLLKDWPADKLTHQTAPTDNHVLWTIGHLIGTDAWLCDLVGAPRVKAPESLLKNCGMGSRPTKNPADYVPLPEALDLLASARAGLIDWLRGAADAQLTAPLGDKTGGFANDPLDAAFKLAWHEGWHAGQIASLRKSLGLPPAVG
jgi:hypothetical protein